MTTIDPTEDSESASNRKENPAGEHVEASVDKGKTTDHVELLEQQVENQSQPQQMKDRTAAQPEKEELGDRVIDPNAAETTERLQGDVKTPFVGEDTNIQLERGENSGDIETSETQSDSELDKMESGEDRARSPADPIALHNTSQLPTNTKEAVQDPSVVDGTPSATDNGVIDVDTFDDEASDGEEADSSQAPDEGSAEFEDTDETPNNERQTLRLHSAEGEPIDLTVSPPRQSKATPMLPENDGNIAIEDTIRPEGNEEINREGVVDVDEPEEPTEETTALEIAKQTFAAEVLNSSSVEEDEKHGKGTTDTETVSADLNVDLNGEDGSPGEAPLTSNAIESSAERRIESDSFEDRSREAEHDKKEEQFAMEVRNDSEDGMHDAPVDEGANKTDEGTNLVNTGVGKPVTEEIEPLPAQDESEDDEEEDDIAGKRGRQGGEDIEEKQNRSLTAPREVTSLEKEVQEEAIPRDHTEVLLEGILDTELHPEENSTQLLTGDENKETTSQGKQTSEETAQPSSGGLSSIKAMSGTDVAPVTSVRTSNLVEIKEASEPDASVIEPIASKGKTLAKTVVRDVIVRPTHEGITPDPVSDETRIPKEREGIASGTDRQIPKNVGTEEPKIDVVMGPVEDEKKIKSASDSTVPSMGASSDLSNRDSQAPRVSENEANRFTETAPVHYPDSSATSEAAKQAPDHNTKNTAEQSKSVNTGHLAPMFGIQLSRPIKSGPVSFSSPPSFPRYSLNPQAVPFLPAKLRKVDSPTEPTDAFKIPSAAVATPSNEKEVTDAEALHIAVEKDDKANATDGEDLKCNKMEASPTKSPSEKSSSIPAKSQISTSKTSLADVATEPVKTTLTDDLTRPAASLNLVSAPKSPTKKPAQKKVSFAPSPIKCDESMPEPEQEHKTESDSMPSEAFQEGAKEKKNALAAQPALPSAKVESEEQAKSDKGPAEADLLKEEQRLIQVQTDEGLRTEVNNVTVAMRQGNSKVRPERKKFTVRLTTGTHEKAKLQLFKASGPSLKLYASLDSSRDNLRVRKVTNRQYVLSVAKVAPPGDDKADIVVKYFLHFDERDTFEEMHSQCMANLQKQMKPVVRVKKPDENSKAPQAAVEKMTEDASRLSPKNGGVKRPANSANAAQASKRSKLLADKKKLLDKMAALRRKKEQKGALVAKERLTQSSSKGVPGGTSGSSVSDKGPTSSVPVKKKDMQAEPKSSKKDSKDGQENVTISGEIVQPSRKRTAEEMSNENANKKARLPASHSTSNAANKIRALPSEGQSNASKMGPTSVRATQDALKEHSVHAGTSHSKVIANLPKKDTALSQRNADELSQGKEAPQGLASDEQKLKEVMLLVKVTKDLKHSQEEKKALQTELGRQNRSLQAEREKSVRVQQENSDALRRIILTVEALNADIECLRKEERDRSLESLTRCEASSSEDFFDRLHSFRPSTWAAFENSEIGALECALRGWYNSGPHKIRSSEGSEITLSQSFDDSKFRQGEIERVHSLLREGHCLLSGWIGQSCPESFRTLEGSQRMLTKEQLKANVDGLRNMGLERCGTRFEWGTSALLLSDDPCQKLAAYNWCPDGECLRCLWCNRRVIVEGESRFNAKSKHYAFCPFRTEHWETSVLRNATIFGIEGDRDIMMKD